MPYDSLFKLAGGMGYSADLERSLDGREQICFLSSGNIRLFVVAIRDKGTYVFAGTAAPRRIFRLGKNARLEELCTALVSEFRNAGASRFASDFIIRLIEKFGLHEIDRNF